MVSAVLGTAEHALFQAASLSTQTWIKQGCEGEDACLGQERFLEAQPPQLLTYSAVDGRGQSEECSDQTGDFIASDGLQL